MPTLDITRSTEDAFAFDMSSGRLLATMLYPADSATRERVANLWGAFLKQYPGPGQPATDYQMAIFETLSEHYTLPHKQWRAGMAAGRILRLVRQIATHRPKSEASVGKSIHVLTNTHEILGKSMGRSVVREVWRDFRSVSHLWVAAEQLSLTKRPKRPKIDFRHISEPNRTTLQGIFDLQGITDLHSTITDNPQSVVSIAEEWRQFGETFQTSRQKSPLLDSEETWVVPKDYDLVENCPVIPALNQDESNCLASYRAPAHY